MLLYSIELSIISLFYRSSSTHLFRHEAWARFGSVPACRPLFRHAMFQVSPGIITNRDVPLSPAHAMAWLPPNPTVVWPRRGPCSLIRPSTQHASNIIFIPRRQNPRAEPDSGRGCRRKAVPVTEDGGACLSACDSAGWPLVFSKKETRARHMEISCFLREIRFSRSISRTYGLVIMIRSPLSASSVKPLDRLLAGAMAFPAPARCLPLRGNDVFA